MAPNWMNEQRNFLVIIIIIDRMKVGTLDVVEQKP